MWELCGCLIFTPSGVFTSRVNSDVMINPDEDLVIKLVSCNFQKKDENAFTRSPKSFSSSLPFSPLFSTSSYLLSFSLFPFRSPLSPYDFLPFLNTILLTAAETCNCHYTTFKHNTDN